MSVRGRARHGPGRVAEGFGLCYLHACKRLFLQTFLPISRETDAMRLWVDQLSNSPTDFVFESESPWLPSAIQPRQESPGRVAEPVRFAFRAHWVAESVCIEGDVCGGVDLECGRCLARYRHELEEPFRLVLEPAGDRSPADPEAAEALARDGMCLGEAFETGWFRGGEIQLSGFARELVALSLPVNPLCSEDCPGLCPTCGADRNVETCDCEVSRPNSPFAVLEKLRTRAKSKNHERGTR